MRIDVKQKHRKREMEAAPRPIRKISTYFDWRCSKPDYMHRLLPIIKKYASEVDHITEFGFRLGESACAFLASEPKKFITYDIDPFCSATYDLLNSLKCTKTEFIFKCVDVNKVDIEETDILFLDASLISNNLRKVLERHVDYVKKYIMVHDTELFGKADLEGGEGLTSTIEDFLQSNKEWEIDNHYIESGGLTVLVKR